MTTLTWDLIGGNPAPGDPAAYRELARAFSQTAENADGARRRLQDFGASCDDTIWRGEAADAFRDKIKELPPKLEKLHRSYDTASRAMGTYGSVLGDLQSRARALLEQADAARRDEQVQQQNRDQALAAAPDPGILGFLSNPSSPFDQAVDDARNRQRDVEGQADDLRDDKRAAENDAVAGLDRASDLGMKNDSWFQQRLHDIDRFVDRHADLLEKISGALKIVSAVAGLLAFVPFLAPVCGPIALIAGGAALLLDASLAATGNGSWKGVLVDAAMMAVPGAGKVFSGAAKAGRVGKGAGAAHAVDEPMAAMAQGTSFVARSPNTYARPSGYRKGVRAKVWDGAVEPATGRVRDPLTGRFLSKDKPWDMGHRPGHEYRKHKVSASERGIDRTTFLDEHNVPEHYRPELPSSNQSHKGEDLTDSYFGP